MKESRSHTGICVMQKTFSFTYTLGAAPVPHIPNTRLLLIWGKQPVYSGSTRGNSSKSWMQENAGSR